VIKARPYQSLTCSISPRTCTAARLSQSNFARPVQAPRPNHSFAHFGAALNAITRRRSGADGSTLAIRFIFGSALPEGRFSRMISGAGNRIPRAKQPKGCFQCPVVCELSGFYWPRARALNKKARAAHFPFVSASVGAIWSQCHGSKRRACKEA
jgi:hypothetical protein